VVELRSQQVVAALDRLTAPGMSDSPTERTPEADAAGANRADEAESELLASSYLITMNGAGSPPASPAETNTRPL
jgi:hypothetical protein